MAKSVKSKTAYSARLPNGEALTLVYGDDALSVFVNGKKTLVQVQAPKVWRSLDTKLVGDCKPG